MQNIRPTKDQFQLFARYSDYISIIRNCNKINDPINQRKLSGKLDLTKGRVGVVIEKLEKNGLIIREHREEFQEKGGKSKFLFVTPIAEKLYDDYHKSVKDKLESNLVKEDITKIERLIKKFKTETDKNIKVLKLIQINTSLNDIDYNIDWEDFQKLKNFINNNINDVLNSHWEIRQKFFNIHIKMINNGFKDNKIFNKISDVLLNDEFQIKVRNVNDKVDNIPIKPAYQSFGLTLQPIIQITTYDILNYPNDCMESKKLFVKLFFKFGDLTDYVHIIQWENVRNNIYGFDRGIKDDLMNQIEQNIKDHNNLDEEPNRILSFRHLIENLT